MNQIEAEDQKYWTDVQAVQEWWEHSRWGHTKRSFTADQIVAKRGNLHIEYPSHNMSKKLWNILEGHFQVCLFSYYGIWPLLNGELNRTRRRALHTAV
jgi:isocitrate lyase